MLDGLLSLFGSIFGFLGGLLPENPFAGVLEVTDNIRLGLAWLNWFMPISEMIVIASLWIAACVAVAAIRTALEVSSSVGGKVAGK